MYVYAYQVRPALSRREAAAIRELLDEQCRMASAAGRAWAGRVVEDYDVTRILIISDAMAPDEPSNLVLEAELLRCEATFSLTAPMSVAAPVPGAAIDGHGR